MSTEPSPQNAAHEGREDDRGASVSHIVATGSRAPILTRARAGDDTALCNEATEHREAG